MCKACPGCTGLLGQQWDMLFFYNHNVAANEKMKKSRMPPFSDAPAAAV
jgi:hypothetical protein